MLKSIAVAALSAVTMVPAASAWQIQPGEQDVSASTSGVGIQPPPPNLALELAPVTGFTTDWHPAPEGFTLPVGEIVYLRQTLSPGMAVEWVGADEMARDEEHSLAGVPLGEVGFHEVLVKLYPEPLGDGQTPEGFHWTHGCVIAATDAPLGQVAMGAIAAQVPLADLGEDTTGTDGLQLYFADESIADLTTLRDGWYATSVKRMVQMEVGADDEALLPMVEWRVDGEAVGLGPTHQLRFQEPGSHLVEAGPPGNAALMQVEAYRVDIVRKWPADAWPDGAPMTFVAETEPPGFEPYVRWLAADKLGIASQVTATGPVFTTVFDGSYGPLGQAQAWMGVKADNAYLGADTNCNPLPVMVLPFEPTVLTGIEVLAANQLATCADETGMDRVRFEFSDDGGQTWSTVDDITGGALETQSALGFYETRWDTTEVPSGSYDVRVTMRLPGQISFSSAPVSVTVNAAPVPSATAVAPGTPGLVSFDASSSFDPDGTIVSWSWDLGDGSTATGPLVNHVYADTSQPYDVFVTTVDSSGAARSEYYSLGFLSPSVIAWILANTCTCVAIELRGDDPAEKALGPDGVDDATGWGETADSDDGVTLGPMHDNPSNKTIAGEKNRSGYGFEVVATVVGNPKLCPEIQLVKGSVRLGGISEAACTAAGLLYDAATGECERCLTWEGTGKDLDKDGTVDLDVDTKPKCEDPPVEGTWDGTKCKVCYPQSGTKYRPDEYEQGEKGGAYEEPFSWKAYAGNKIIWYDTPSQPGKTNGRKLKADFVAIVRDSHGGKACYMKYSMCVENKAGKDVETLTLTDAGGAGHVGAIPGVP